MTKTLLSAFVLCALAAGCNGGAQEAGPVPTTSQGSGSTGATSTSEGASNAAATSTAPSTPLCASTTSAIKAQSQEGAAGTIRTVWRVKNMSGATCRSFGYPGMDFHAASGWLDVQVHRGGIDMISQPPAPVVLEPGKSLYFVSFWADVDTDAGPCTQFDRVKVTLPDNFTPAQVDSSGCVDPGLVNVGPVTSSPPA